MRLSERHWGLKAHRDRAEGLVAAAHKLVRVLYGMLRSQSPYDENEAFKLTPQTLARRRKNLEKQAKALGFQLAKVA